MTTNIIRPVNGTNRVRPLNDGTDWGAIISQGFAFAGAAISGKQTNTAAQIQADLSKAQLALEQAQTLAAARIAEAQAAGDTAKANAEIAQIEAQTRLLEAQIAAAAKETGVAAPKSGSTGWWAARSNVEKGLMIGGSLLAIGGTIYYFSQRNTKKRRR